MDGERLSVAVDQIHYGMTTTCLTAGDYEYHPVCKIERCHWWPATPVAKHLAYILLVLDAYGLLNGIDKARA